LLQLLSADDNGDLMQEMVDVETKLSELQQEQLKSKKLELEAAQERNLAIENLEKAVR